MAQFYTFPCSCAVQVLGGFTDGAGLPTESLALRHRLTVSVLSEAQERQEGDELRKLGFIKLGTFNTAHEVRHKLSLWVAGAEFQKEKEKDEYAEDYGNK